MAKWVGISLQAVGAQILKAKSPFFKMVQTRLVAEAWRNEKISLGEPEDLDDYPARPKKPTLVDAKDMKLQSGVPMEIQMLHSLAHIELGAIDNYWDTIVRFDSSQYRLPKQYFDDMVSIVDDEAKHFGWLISALSHKKTEYGDLLAHKGLLEHSANTKSDLMARLAVIPLVQEARGLDAGPRLIQKLTSVGAISSAHLVQQIVSEEINHVRIGVRWFQYLCTEKGLDHTKHFQSLVLQFYPQGLPGPFAAADRMMAGMPPEYFQQISRKQTAHVP
jgi:uncharacterized ferritin-like protein (DUF455 family)